jgi:hypothetical protein
MHCHNGHARKTSLFAGIEAIRHDMHQLVIAPGPERTQELSPELLEVTPIERDENLRRLARDLSAASVRGSRLAARLGGNMARRQPGKIFDAPAQGPQVVAKALAFAPAGGPAKSDQGKRRTTNQHGSHRHVPARMGTFSIAQIIGG